MQPTTDNLFVFSRALMAVLDNLDYLGWLHQDGHLSWEGTMSEKYILYARKSTDVEDKQVLSIEAQLVELRAYARNENLQIIDELIEKQSAKVPGRPVFNKMLARIEASEADGIIAWHPDRLARNSIDGGQIIYLLDQSRLNVLKFPSFWFENTSQGKFMLSIAFGQSKYYVDNLSENTKRGLRQKVRRGEMPGRAPLGYINDMRTKTVVVDKRRAPLVIEAFQLYAKGQSRLQDIADFLFSKGIKTKGNKLLKKDQITKLLTNPFYYGHFRYAGEVFEGKHTPIISKKLFDNVQQVIDRRKHKRTTKQNDPKPLCGLLRCGSCNMMITGENQTKRQKNGNIHHYVYYHCTKKRKNTPRCPEPHIREELLDAQLSEMLQEYAMPLVWADKLRELMDKDVSDQQTRSQAQTAGLQANITGLSAKLQRLLDSYLDQDIDRETYIGKKAEIMSQKKGFEEKLSKLMLGQNLWLEPMKKWLETAVSICKIAESDDLLAKKSLCLEIFGSNLILKNKKARLRVLEPQFSPQKNRWVLLRKTVISQAKQALSRPSVQFCP
ncbi:MAG: recombinase family protein, partial [Negativicutes bacterium]|nr:recombinase family protein [Negativicutes bacterium]